MESRGQDQPLTLKLPWPLSVNAMYRTFRGRLILSKRGRQYQTEAVAAILEQKRRKFKYRVEILFELFPPDERRRDIDNTLKGLLDALVHSNILEDDSQVDDLRIVRKHVKKCGQVLVTIKELTGGQPRLVGCPEEP